jgi:hypothetical protein
MLFEGYISSTPRNVRLNLYHPKAEPANQHAAHEPHVMWHDMGLFCHPPAASLQTYAAVTFSFKT